MKPGKILIVDDEKDILSLMEEIFQEEGYQVTTAANGTQAQVIWQDQPPDVIFLDIWMPDTDGITLLKSMIQEKILENTCVIMMSGHGTIETAIDAIKLGAYDFLEKPLSLAKLLISAEKAMNHIQLRHENRHLKQKLPEQFLPIGKSKLIQDLRDTIERLSKYSMPIFITGEVGTGKHRIAEAIYRLSNQSEHKLLEINASDFQEQHHLLLGEESDNTPSIGELSHADNGTLIINQIENLCSAGQKFLAQLLDKNSYCRLNSLKELPINLRVIAISNMDIEGLERLKFNDTVLRKLEPIQIHTPSLCQHTEDLPELIDYFIDFFLTHEGLKYREFSIAAKNTLRQYSWPGNFKELKNFIQRLLILGDGQVTDEEVKALLKSNQTKHAYLAESIDTSIPLKQAKELFEGTYLRQLLIENGGNVSATAKSSGLERTNLYRKLKTLNIDPKNPK